MDITIVANNYLKLTKFVETDLFQHLTDLQFRAAASALNGLKYANDKKSVYWSVINHLEDAEQSLIAQSKKSLIDFEDSLRKYIYISALKALIYKFLDEIKLANKCCDDTLAFIKSATNLSFKQGLSTFFTVLKFSTWQSVFTPTVLEKKAKDFNVRLFWKNLIDRDEDFSIPGFDDYGGEPSVS